MEIENLINQKDGKFDKQGRVGFYKRNQSIRLRISYNYGSYSLTIKGGITKDSLKAAKAQANIINGDLALNQFDTTLQKYDPDRALRAKILETIKEPDLKEIWEMYKETKKHQSALTTQKYQWAEIDRLLDNLSPKNLRLSELHNLGQACLKIRALSTTHRAFQLLNAAITLYSGENKKLKRQLPKEQKNPVEWLAPQEVKFILEAFRTNRYNDDKSHYAHSFYYPYVAFLAHTGCRPEEALALNWEDLKWSEGGSQCKVKINKAYSKGILLPHTKNYKIRTISLSPALIEILQNTDKYFPKKRKTIFAGYEGGYLNHANFGRRQWQPILYNLVRNNLVREYLRPYSLRHSFVTNMHYKGEISLVTIAGLIGDKVETVIRNYTGLKPIDPANVPNLYSVDIKATRE